MSNQLTRNQVRTSASNTASDFINSVYVFIERQKTIETGAVSAFNAAFMLNTDLVYQPIAQYYTQF